MNEPARQADRNPPGPPDVPLRFRLSRGSYFVFLGSVSTVVGNVTISIILARYLGSGGLGVYTIYTVIGLVFVPLFAFSIPSAITRSVADLRQSQGERLRLMLPTSLFLMLAATTLGTFLLFLGSPLLSELYATSEIEMMVRILAAFSLANIVALFASAVLQGFEDFQAVGIIGSLATVANVALLLILLPTLGVIGAAWSAAAVSVCNAGLGLVAVRGVLRRHGIAWRWSFSRMEARRVFAFSAPLNAASVIARLSTFVQNSLVAIGLGFQDLGLLRIAGVFFGAILFVPRSALGSMLPILSSMAATRTEERSREILTQLVKFSILIVLPIAGGLVLALPFVISLLYGVAFLGAEPFALLTIVLALITFPNAILGEQYLLARGRTVAGLLVTSCSAGLSLALVIVLLPRLGAIALPVSALATESTLFIVLLAWTSKRLEIDLRSLRTTLGFLVATTVVLAFGATILPISARLVGAPLGVALLAAIGYFLVLSGQERQLFISTIRRGLYRLAGR